MLGILLVVVPTAPNDCTRHSGERGTSIEVLKKVNLDTCLFFVLTVGKIRNFDHLFLISLESPNPVSDFYP